MKNDIKQRTNTVQPLNSDEKVAALEYVIGFIETMAEYELPTDIEITKIELFGSRINGGCTEESDLDVLVKYKNTGDKYWKESHIFNMLCGEDNYYDGIKLDFFPVLEE